MTLMIDEIKEEPAAIERTYRRNSSMLHELPDTLRKSRFVFVTGSGTSFHAAHYLNLLLLANGIPSVSLHSPDYSDFIVSKLANGAINIVFSQSGESVDALQNLKLSKRKHMRVIGITNEENSTLARESDIPIITDAGKENSVAATKSHTVQLAVSMALFNELNFADSNSEINRVCDGIRRVISDMAVIERSATTLTNKVVFLGSGINYAAAMEGDLKFKETSGINTEAYSTREYLHGPIHRIDKDTSVVLLSGDTDTDQSVLRRLKVTTGNVLKIGDEESQIKVPQGNAVVLPIYYVTVLQIMANAKALQLGFDPDHPKNLTKVIKE